MNTSISIFLNTSPLGRTHIYKVPEFNNSNCKILVNLFDIQCNEINDWNLVINHDVPKLGYYKNRIIHKIGVALKHKSLIKKIKSIDIENFDMVNIFYQDYDVSTNYIIHFFKPHIRKKIFVIEDGIVNYSEIKKLSFLRCIFKKVFYNLLGIPYKFLTTSVTAIEQNFVNAQYVQFPKMSNNPAKSLAIRVENLTYQPDTSAILILGQEAFIGYKSITYDYYIECLNDIIQYCTQKRVQENFRIYYKPHRNGSRIDTKKLSHPHLITYIYDERPIENIITKYLPTEIYSFNSSALFNIKLSLNENLKHKIKIYSFSKLHHNESMEKLFLKAGIIPINNEE